MSPPKKISLWQAYTILRDGLREKPSTTLVGDAIHRLATTATTASDAISNANIFHKKQLTNENYELIKHSIAGLSFLLLIYAHKSEIREELFDLMRLYVQYLQAIASAEIPMPLRVVINCVANFSVENKQKGAELAAKAFQAILEGRNNEGSLQIGLERNKEIIAAVVLFNPALTNTPINHDFLLLPAGFKCEVEQRKRPSGDIISIPGGSIESSSLVFTLLPCTLNRDDIHYIFQKFFRTLDFIVNEQHRLHGSDDPQAEHIPLIEWFFRESAPKQGTGNYMNSWLTHSKGASTITEMAQRAKTFMETHGIILEAPSLEEIVALTHKIIDSAVLPQLLTSSSLAFSIFCETSVINFEHPERLTMAPLTKP